jgi:plasmid stabilization system protein ParE
MPGVFITTKARNDLDGIWDHIFNDNLAAADNLIDQLWVRFRLLADNRLLGELQPLPCKRYLSPPHFSATTSSTTTLAGMTWPLFEFYTPH